MTQAEQFVKQKYGVPIEALKLSTEEMFQLMDNFVYETIKKIIKDSHFKDKNGKVHIYAGDLMENISKIVEKFHQV
jgi:hypothetical protein